MEINSKSVKIFGCQRGAVVETREAKWDVMGGKIKVKISFSIAR